MDKKEKLFNFYCLADSQKKVLFWGKLTTDAQK